MADRKVTCVTKDKDGDITAIGNNGAPWSPRSNKDAIKDIDDGTHRYYVLVGVYEEDVHVVDGENKRYLRTNKDETKVNNLDELPEC